MSKQFSTRCRPERPICRPSCGSASTVPIASARAAGSRGGDENAGDAGFDNFRIAANVGRHHRQPAGHRFQQASAKSPRFATATRTAGPAKAAPARPRLPPERSRCPARFNSFASAINSPRHGPSPAISKRAAGCSATTRAAARSKFAMSFSGLSRATVTIGPSSIGPWKAKRVKSMPLWIVRIRSLRNALLDHEAAAIVAKRRRSDPRIGRPAGSRSVAAR